MNDSADLRFLLTIRERQARASAARADANLHAIFADRISPNAAVAGGTLSRNESMS
ncbi:hypothetical protein VOM14_10850 [Paraburkholderia sp. MPAMCS5]|uniref:hypothetical protein n=1 Tax=Paraburkholderia sp. MPAMCS5 TaxID=3112563 RepID=UPI002E197FA0|nr:hypothetical protein [Paraburkholderia sp. MPAMCS5]